MATAATQNPPRERKLSMSAPISSLMQGPVGPVFTRPKHKRTFTGFGAGDIKSVEASIPEPQREAYETPLSPIAPATANPNLQMAKIRMKPITSPLTAKTRLTLLLVCLRL